MVKGEKLRRLRNALIRGPGGLGRLLPIAVPMIISQVFDTIMMFVDRLFLSWVSPLAMASCMSGGLTAFLCGQIPFGIVSYCTTLVAHRYGAGRKEQCGRVVLQGVWVACAAYPLVLLAGRGLVVKVFALAGHSPEQIAMEQTYFSIIISASILGLLRAAFSSFFAGIGKTRIIMLGNIVALFTNVIGNYVLIFGKLGFPAMGIVGAAWGTVLAIGVMMLVMGSAFFHEVRRAPFRGERLLVFDREICRQLLRFGLPNGLDGFLCLMCFNAIVLMIHGMGEEVAAAITMMFNWELVSFFPMLGVQIAVSTLVGQNMGARHIKGVRQTVRSGLTLVLTYTSLLALVFLTMPRSLLSLFGHAAAPEIINLAVPMLQLTSIYLACDGAAIVFSGVLRGAGDTFWVMVLGIAYHLAMVAVCVAAIHVFKFSAVWVWGSVCFAVLLGGLSFYLRYRQGNWQRHNLLALT